MPSLPESVVTASSPPPHGKYVGSVGKPPFMSRFPVDNSEFSKTEKGVGEERGHANRTRHGVLTNCCTEVVMMVIVVKFVDRRQGGEGGFRTHGVGGAVLRERRSGLETSRVPMGPDAELTNVIVSVTGEHQASSVVGERKEQGSEVKMTRETRQT